MTDDVEPADRLHGFMSGYHATQYVRLGVACGLFEALTAPRTAAALAAERDLHEPYVQVFCEVGLRWGLLAVDGESVDATSEFRLREAFVPYLGDPSAIQYMGELFRLAVDHQGADYREYPERFRTGERVPFHERSDEFSRTVEQCTRGLQVIFAQKLVPESLPRLDDRLSGPARLLDVGCGSGHLVCHLAERNPDLEAVGVDLDGDAVRRARDRASDRDLSGRVRFERADAATLSTDDPFDAATSFLSLHEVPPPDREGVVTRVGELLAPDGVFAVFDEVYPRTVDEFRRPPYTNAVESQWAEVTWGNRLPTAAEQRSLLDRAGLAERTRSSFADRFVLFEATAQE